MVVKDRGLIMHWLRKRFYCLGSYFPLQGEEIKSGFALNYFTWNSHAIDIKLPRFFCAGCKRHGLFFRPLSFLQATLSGLRGEISSLQDQLDEHTEAVQTSSKAWK